METKVVNFLLESGLSLAIFTLVYQLFLRKETFFVLNRIYLLASVCFSMILPFIHFGNHSGISSILLGEVKVTPNGYQSLLQTVFVYGTDLSGTVMNIVQSIGMISLIYLLGAAIFFVVFLFRLSQITALILKNESELKDGIRIIKINRDTTPFSFFNFVFVSRNGANSKGIKEMMAHELEHVRQGHSFDVLILELLTIVQWFNPFMWILKRSVRENHEFLADHGVLKPEVSSAAYRMLLLNSAFIQQPVIANNFNYSLIKNRIKMITKIKSPKTAAAKFSFGILVTVALLVIFAFDSAKSQNQDPQTPVKEFHVTVQGTPITDKDQVFIVVEQMASFQGSDVNAFREWIVKNLKYPDEAVKKHISGKVYVQFVVNTEGETEDVKVVRGIDPSLDKEAIRVVKASPKWEPAMQKGTKVKQQFTIPITFFLP